MLLFDTMADEVLQRAGLSKQGNEEAHREVASILAASMAHLSAAQALGQLTAHERVDAFELQKSVLVDDLKDRLQS